MVREVGVSMVREAGISSSSSSSVFYSPGGHCEVLGATVRS